MITAQYSSTTLIFIMSSSLVQLFLLALISIVTVNGVTRLTAVNVANPGEFPFLASIRIKGVHVCGGSILSPQFILTAGHCVKAAKNVNLNDVTVVTGSVQLSQGGYTSKVASIHNDAENGENPDTDIGLIKLIVPLDYDSYTNSIRYSTNLPNMDDFGTVIGWGSARSNETAAVDMLQYMYAYITDLTCNGFYTTKHAICTNNGPTIGVCYGDSGSPLIYNGLVVGVVSRAVLCAKGVPDVYSSTAYNINFIRRILATA